MTDILVADDSLVTQLLMTQILESKGYVVYVVSNGRQALDFLQEHGADLVIIDIGMPVMDGPELIRRMQADERWQLTPVILITSVEDRLERVGQRTVDEFLTKPVSIDQLLASVKRSLSL